MMVSEVDVNARVSETPTVNSWRMHMPDTTQTVPQEPTELPNKVCHSCRGKIDDAFSWQVHPDYSFHPHCLKCSECGCYFQDATSCFMKNELAYCKEDYERLYMEHCAKCDHALQPTDLVHKVKNCTFHVDCFSCSSCVRVLVSGDEFLLIETRLFCRPCHELESEQSRQNQFRCREMERRNKPKTTRVRTVLNEKQLHTLRTCYQANPRPDALMKEQLVEMTGLSPRVIRVWFQNKRCKDKKKQIMIKQLEDQRNSQDSGTDETKSIASCKAVSLVATDPVPDNPQQKLDTEIEIKSYQKRAHSHIRLYNSFLKNNKVIYLKLSCVARYSKMTGSRSTRSRIGKITRCNNSLVSVLCDVLDVVRKLPGLNLRQSLLTGPIR
uniref:Islet n=1 Tax=Oikopleura dioica TaxID=34765 RepID=Q5EVH6_OIKDI|nr:Islet [Oikopleura dioica]